MLTTRARREAFACPFFSVTEEEVTLADGTESRFWFVERSGFAIVAAVEDGAIWMVEQWRHPVKRRSLELPMGAAPGAPEQMARTELAEETGLRAERMTRLGEIALAPGMMAHAGTLFLAEGLTQGPTAHEPGELGMTAAPWRFEALRAAMRDGRLREATSLAALSLLSAHGVF